MVYIEHNMHNSKAEQIHIYILGINCHTISCYAKRLRLQEGGVSGRGICVCVCVVSTYELIVLQFPMLIC